jgi:acid phosphatase
MATTSYAQVDKTVREIASSYDGDRVPWVVFDVDETLLTCRHLKPKDRGHMYALQHKGILSGIATMVELHNWLVSKGIKIALITGRGQYLTDITMDNLHKVGVKGSSRLYTRSGKRGIPTTAYKMAARKDIYDDGGTILANIGDQPTDLEGGYSEHTFLLPSTY